MCVWKLHLVIINVAQPYPKFDGRDLSSSSLSTSDMLWTRTAVNNGNIMEFWARHRHEDGRRIGGEEAVSIALLKYINKSHPSAHETTARVSTLQAASKEQGRKKKRWKKIWKNQKANLHGKYKGDRQMDTTIVGIGDLFRLSLPPPSLSDHRQRHR